MQIEHVKLDFRMTCPLINEGISAIKNIKREFNLKLPDNWN